MVRDIVHIQIETPRSWLRESKHGLMTSINTKRILNVVWLPEQKGVERLWIFQACILTLHPVEVDVMKCASLDHTVKRMGETWVKFERSHVRVKLGAHTIIHNNYYHSTWHEIQTQSRSLIKSVIYTNHCIKMREDGKKFRQVKKSRSKTSITLRKSVFWLANLLWHCWFRRHQLISI